MQETLNLSGQRLEVLPELTPPGPRWLLAFANRLVTLPESIGALGRLEGLVVTDNALKRLPALQDCTALHTLQVARNQLTTLPPLPPLRTLDVSTNPLGALPASITALTQLEHLDLSRCGLKELPESIGRLSALRTLVLDHNPLMGLPDSIGQLERLELLSLGDTALTTLPVLPPRLRWLRLDGCALGEVPASLSTLACLDRLDLARCGLVDASAIPNCRELNLFDNDLSELPAHLWSLRSLEHLSAGGNRLTALPPGEHLRLRSLELSGNALHRIVMPLLPALVRMDLSNNPLDIPPRGLHRLHQLHTLDLSNTGLRWLSPRMGALHALVNLDLYGDPIAQLPPGLSALPNLRTLHLSARPVRTLPSRWLASMALETLSVSGIRVSDAPAALRLLTPQEILSRVCENIPQ